MKTVSLLEAKGGITLRRVLTLEDNERFPNATQVPKKTQIQKIVIRKADVSGSNRQMKCCLLRKGKGKQEGRNKTTIAKKKKRVSGEYTTGLQPSKPMGTKVIQGKWGGKNEKANRRSQGRGGTKRIQKKGGGKSRRNQGGGAKTFKVGRAGCSGKPRIALLHWGGIFHIKRKGKKQNGKKVNRHLTQRNCPLWLEKRLDEKEEKGEVPPPEV